MGAPTQQPVSVQFLMALGAIGGLNNIGMNFSDNSTQAAYLATAPILLPLTKAQVAINFATLFPGFTTFNYVFIREVTSPSLLGFNLTDTMASTGPVFMAPWVGGSGGSQPTMYARAATAANTYLVVGAIGS